MRLQRTISEAVCVEGFGYWSGKDVRVEFRPAPEETGLVFVRTDFPAPIRIPALAPFRVESPRRTTLVSGNTRVEMVEHVLAACAGLQVDNCEIWVDQAEMPGCDGSSAAFTAALRSARIVEQNVSRRQLVVQRTIRVGDEQRWVEVQPAGHSGLSIRYELDYGTQRSIGRQQLELALTPQGFERELAPARTFLLKAEADWMRSRGLGARVTSRDLLVFDEDGPIDNSLRFEDECVRHKLLDVVGDLALAGCDIVGRVVAHRSGHALNTELASVLGSEQAMIRRRTA